jgi:hypothetical protein
LLPRFLEGVTDPWPGGNVLGVAGILTNLFPQACDSYLEDVCITAIFSTPNLGQKMFMRNHSTGVTSQQTENPVFGGWQHNLSFIYGYQMMVEVYAQLA